jgi:hypothetical protein
MKNDGENGFAEMEYKMFITRVLFPKLKFLFFLDKNMSLMSLNHLNLNIYKGLAPSRFWICSF